MARRRSEQGRKRKAKRRWRPHLTPAPGRALERALRHGGVSRIVRSYEDGLRDPRFERLLRRIHRAAVFAGNRVEIFVAGDAAFRSMRGALREAKEEVLLESYILRDDATGWEFLNELGAAVDRGVTVRLLADAFGS
ncbi:MAG TPA: hypothetical protein VKA53_10860, partial [Thermoanaerobaculia bacterium]|nr:hypothetical protein [Thermoanaerobaculia bacterium]